MTVETISAQQLWLEELEQIVQFTAHDVRNQLNSVAVNLQVLQSRIGRGDTAAERLSTHANGAAAEFEELAERVQALMALTRVSGNAELSSVLLATERLAGSNRAGEHLVQVQGIPPVVRLPVHAGAARVIVVHLIMQVVRAGETVAVELFDSVPVRLQLRFASSIEVRPSADVMQLAASLGIHLHRNPGCVELSFPTVWPGTAGLV